MIGGAILAPYSAARAATKTRIYSGSISKDITDCNKPPQKNAKYDSIDRVKLDLLYTLNVFNGRNIISLGDENASGEEDPDNIEASLIGRSFAGAKGSKPGSLIFRSLKSFPVATLLDGENCRAQVSVQFGAESKAHRRPVEALMQYTCKTLVESTPAGDTDIRRSRQNVACRVRYRGTISLK